MRLGDTWREARGANQTIAVEWYDALLIYIVCIFTKILMSVFLSI